jgi:hypothetical protein
VSISETTSVVLGLFARFSIYLSIYLSAKRTRKFAVNMASAWWDPMRMQSNDLLEAAGHHSAPAPNTPWQARTHPTSRPASRPASRAASRPAAAPSDSLARHMPPLCPRAAVPWPTPMHAELFRFSDAPHAPAQTLIIAAFLTGASNVHTQGSFASMRSSKHASDAKRILGFVQSFLGRSPGFCDPSVTLHVVHDLGRADMPKVWRGVFFHAFPPRPDRVLGDARYPLFAEVLNREESWDCAFAIDLTDVVLLRLPPCNALPDDRLVIATDGCNPKVKKWLMKATGRTRLNESVSPAFRQFSTNSSRQLVLNSGVVGGRRAAFLPALAEVNARLRSHWERCPPFLAGADMVLWNEAALTRPLVLGYPHGPVNLPMWGGFNGDACRKGSPIVPECHRHDWVDASMRLGLHWFAHKMEYNWERRMLSGNWTKGAVRGYRSARAMGELAARCEMCRNASSGKPCKPWHYDAQ